MNFILLAENPNNNLFSEEFGIVVAIVLVVIALVFVAVTALVVFLCYKLIHWLKNVLTRSKLPKPQSTESKDSPQ